MSILIITGNLIYDYKQYCSLNLCVNIFTLGTAAEGGRAGGNFHRRSMCLNTGYGDGIVKQGNIEELFVHEGSHASLDGIHANVGS